MVKAVGNAEFTVACVASVSGQKRKTEVQDFRCFARARNGARAKKTKEGSAGGEGREAGQVAVAHSIIQNYTYHI